MALGSAALQDALDGAVPSKGVRVAAVDEAAGALHEEVHEVGEACSPPAAGVGGPHPPGRRLGRGDGGECGFVGRRVLCLLIVVTEVSFVDETQGLLKRANK